MAKSNLSGLLNSTRPIEGFSNGNQIQYYKRPIEKFTHNYNYKSENNKDYKKQTKITNSNKTIRNPNRKYIPHYTADYYTTKHNNVDKKMKFNMNMNWGNAYANTATNFDRLYSIYPSKEIDNICQYVFMVRPDLNILKNQYELVTYSKSQIESGYYPAASPSNDLFFRYMLKHYPMMLRNLSGNRFPGDHDFIPYLVSRTESMQIPDYTIKSYKFTQPYTNYNMPYASHASESYTGGTFEITFREDNEYRIHKLFQTWLYYIDGVTRNMFGPKMTYIKNNRYDYATSVYCITCAADAETILFWTKYTGCFPTSVPNSDLSFNLRGTPNNKVTIPFDYFLQESLDPHILVDFNKNAHVVNNNSNGLGYIPVYRSKTLGGIGMKDYRTKENKSIGSVNAKTSFSKNTPADLGSGNGLVGCPFICKIDGDYLLRWKKTNISI